MTTIPAPLTTNVKLFSDAALQSAVDKVMASLPEGHTVGWIAHAEMGLDGKPTAVVSVVKKFGERAVLEAAAVYVWGGELKAQVELVGSF